MNKYLTSVALAALLVAAFAIQLSEQKSECERKREDAEKLVKDQEKGRNLAMAIVVPKCNEDGTYAQVQCHHNSPFCQCWDKDGSPLTAPKKNLKKCACSVDRVKALKSIPPSQQGEAILTSCEQDGSYTPKQCSRDACWCVNSDTGKKLGNENKDKSSVKC